MMMHRYAIETRSRNAERGYGIVGNDGAISSQLSVSACGWEDISTLPFLKQSQYGASRWERLASVVGKFN